MDYKTVNALDTSAVAAYRCPGIALRKSESPWYRPCARRGVMKTRLLIVLVIALALPVSAPAQPDKLGKVTFPTSCSAAVQPQFERGVAALHSYWFTEARMTFLAVI